MKQKRKKTTSKISTVITAIVLLIFAVITVSEKLGIDFIPTWDEVYSEAGLSEQQSVGFNVHFIDVGQGDCSLITADGYTVLIDAGERGNEEKVIGYIQKLGIDTLDYVIATHPHSDHIGSLDEVISAFTVKNVIMPRLQKSNTPTTLAYEEFLNAVKTSEAKVIAAQVGSVYSVGKAQIVVLSPSVQSDDLNDMSVAVSIVYGQSSFLFTGDMEKTAEQIILDSEYRDYLRADVLKVGHHGSSTSSGKNFISAVSPSLAIISCGKDNDYGHPHRETVSLFDNFGIETLRTDKSGNIVVSSDGASLDWMCEK